MSLQRYFIEQGVCEECKNAAPFFKKADGFPYLEVHHRVPLAKGGDDTVENGIALCPNCHRKFHFGQ
jgi:5-methylcytosine-specific restriction protein A